MMPIHGRKVRKRVIGESTDDTKFKMIPRHFWVSGKNFHLQSSYSQNGLGN